MKIFFLCLTLCSITKAVYVNRMTPLNRMATFSRVRSPTVFRPGVSLQSFHNMPRPWNYGTMRLASAASNRAPYVFYRSAPQRYALKHYAPSANRNVFTHSPWKTTIRLPSTSSVNQEYEFIRAVSAQPVVHSDGGTGAIHTIPAPNLSLSEKPIVVVETTEDSVSNQPKPSYEVTEKYPESEYNMAKIEQPIGFSKATSSSTPELETLIRNGAALQLASQFSLPAVTVSQHQQILPQPFEMQGIHNLPINTGTEGIFIPPTGLYQSNPILLQKLQSQFMQRFPAMEMFPYAADTSNQNHLQPQPQASQNHPQIVLLENEQFINKPPEMSVPEQNIQNDAIARETQDTSMITLMPHPFILPNTTVKQVEVTTVSQPQNITEGLITAEIQPVTTTIKYIVEAKAEQNTTPIYYAQIGQSIGSVVANGFYSAINDVRAAAAVAQENNTPEQDSDKVVSDITTNLVPAELNTYFLKSDGTSESTTVSELKPLKGAPFKKATDSVNVTYTLVRADDKQPKMTHEGTVYAGQIVEATISEDQDFNKEKATLMSRRAPIRLFAAEDSKSANSTTNTVSVPKVTMVKAKIPPRTKLTFDDKTGEPILRIYASYVDNTSQKDAVISKLASLKPINSFIGSLTKKELIESWKGATVKSVDKSQGADANQVTQFGLKLRERSDDYIPLFEEYDD